MWWGIKKRLPVYGLACKELRSHHSILTTSKAELTEKINNFSLIQQRNEATMQTHTPPIGKTTGEYRGSQLTRTRKPSADVTGNSNKVGKPKLYLVNCWGSV